MSFDEVATEATLRIAQRAIAFDSGRRYEEAIYFYSEAANRILKLLREKKMKPIFRKNAMEYIERAEYLKKELPRLLEMAKGSKSTNQLTFEEAEFAILKAQDLDEQEHYSLALDQYQQAIAVCLKAQEACVDENLRKKIHVVASQALLRAEKLKNEESQRMFEQMAAALPDVPKNVLQTGKSDPVAPVSPRPAPRSPAPPAKPRKEETLSKEEIKVLRETSNINGRDYVPFLSYDLHEKFSFMSPFTDPDGKVALADKQKNRLKGWKRPSEFLQEPMVIKDIDSGTIKQTVISDCSFVSSLSIAARYERRFGKRLVTSIIYPQDTRGRPVYNPSGKYMIKFHINGVWRKVVVDDYFPIGDANNLLCSYSQLNDLWVSLLEKAYMKVMGGYDFPGSNSNIDLHALTGWIPERIAIRKGEEDFNPETVFEKLMSRFHRGDCLITLATGKLSEADCDRAGLVDSHAYAVLDLRRIENKRLLMVKNPWTHLRWKGRFSENDTANWTPELCKALSYDPSKAKEKDDGVFWIDLESVCHFFDVFYVNWNPALFPFTYGIHASWNACAGPVKDLYSVADNPQYTLEVNNKNKAAVWILLTRHITDIDDFANNKEYITVMVYKSGKKVYLPFDPKPIYDGVRINSPHYLCQMIVDEPGLQKYTLVVAQYEKMNTIHYTLRVYSSCSFRLAPMSIPYNTKKTETGEWKGKSAAGCGNGASRELYKFNPLYHLALEEISDENAILIVLKGPKQYSVGFEVRQVSSARNIAFEKVDSGAYRPGYTVLALEKVPAGTYSIRPATFMSGQEGPFILTVEASCKFTLKKVASEE